MLSGLAHPDADLLMLASMASLPSRARLMLVGVKCCVIALWILGVAMLAVSGFDAIFTLCLAIVGTSLLSRDPHLEGCYSCLRESAFGQCFASNGLACLVPFLWLAAVNSFVDFLLLMRVAQAVFAPMNKQDAELKRNPIVMLHLVIFVVEVVAMALSWRVLRELLINNMGLVGLPDGHERLLDDGSGPLQGDPRSRGQVVAPGQQRLGVPPGTVRIAAGPGRPDFIVPFTGNAHKLGD
eukprot:TRINITY_DN30993_c0_g2_i4.p1 TRINITY_DN30993_c0_g2~~TRINITY_DN30993_c0_g2_i4.p1  ORF type:complete len:239 (+),score=30.23 TRINITY_DN30993_c0_g2_i4:154-870(+)